MNEHRPVVDLGSIKKSATDDAWLILRHPVTGDELGIKLKLMSPDSEAYRKLDTRIKNRSFMAAKKNRTVSYDSVQEGAAELLVGVVLAWENVVWDGTPLDCTPENVRSLYEQLPWVREQVDVFISERANFFVG